MTNSPPFPGVRDSAILQLYQALANDWGFLTGQLDLVGAGVGGVMVSLLESPFVSLSNSVYGHRYSIPARRNPPQTTFNVVAQNVYTWQTVLHETKTNITLSPATTTDVGISTDDHTAPLPIMGSPIVIKVLQIGLLKGDLGGDPNAKIHYEVTDNNHDGVPSPDESVKVTGDAGAASYIPGVTDSIQLVDAMRPDDLPVKASVNSNGSFTLTWSRLKAGSTPDILVLSLEPDRVDPQTPLSVTFSRKIKQEGNVYPIKVEKENNGGWEEAKGYPNLEGEGRVLNFNAESAWDGGKRVVSGIFRTFEILQSESVVSMGL